MQPVPVALRAAAGLGQLQWSFIKGSMLKEASYVCPVAFMTHAAPVSMEVYLVRVTMHSNVVTYKAKLLTWQNHIVSV